MLVESGISILAFIAIYMYETEKLPFQKKQHHLPIPGCEWCGIECKENVLTLQGKTFCSHDCMKDWEAHYSG